MRWQLLWTTFSHLSANTPDAVVVNEEPKEVFILETACTFDSSLEEALTTNPSYTPSQSWVTGAGYLCSYLKPRTHSQVGHTRASTAQNAQKGAKRLAKHCAVSAAIGSRHIWRRRCDLYP